MTTSLRTMIFICSCPQMQVLKFQTSTLFTRLDSKTQIISTTMKKSTPRMINALSLAKPLTWFVKVQSKRTKILLLSHTTSSLSDTTRCIQHLSLNSFPTRRQLSNIFIACLITTLFRKSLRKRLWSMESTPASMGSLSNTIKMSKRTEIT